MVQMFEIWWNFIEFPFRIWVFEYLLIQPLIKIWIRIAILSDSEKAH